MLIEFKLGRKQPIDRMTRGIFRVNTMRCVEDHYLAIYTASGSRELRMCRACRTHPRVSH
jgi:hypothetical protein